MVAVIDDLEAVATAAAVSIAPDAVVHVEHGRWVEIAVPLLDGLCISCHGPSEPAWTWLDLSGNVIGYYKRGRCAQCGMVATGWIQSGEHDHADQTAARVSDRVAHTTGIAMRMRDRRIENTARHVTTALTELVSRAALAVRAAHLQPGDHVEIRRMLATVGIVLAADSDPHGLRYTNTGFVATARDPFKVGGVITVTEADLTTPTEDLN